MIKLIIFDLDGTLVHSAPDIITTTNLLLTRRGHQPLPDEQIVNAIGEGIRSLVYSLFPKVEEDEAFLNDLEREFSDLYQKNMLATTDVIAGVTEFLTEWPNRVAILTNKNEAPARKIIQSLALRSFGWVSIIGGDTLAARKPDPLPFLETLTRAGVHASEALMIGDGIPDIIGARNSGIRSVALEFGYTPIERLMELGADYRLSSYADLTALIQKINHSWLAIKY